jgi:pimeloyl-ACP methyl ester carboxylesterase
MKNSIQAKLFIAIVIMIWQTKIMALGLINNVPDTCQLESFPYSTLLYSKITDYQTKVKVYGPPELSRPSEVLREQPVAVIVNGNKMQGDRYLQLVNHLANNRYMVILITRKQTKMADQEQRTDILNAMNAVYGHFQIHPSSPLGLIGHSMGGGVVMELSKQITDQSYLYPFSVRAVVTIAPNSKLVYESGQRVTAYDTPAYLGIYGSQDMDMKGTNSSYVAYEAYDFVGNEISTMNPLVFNQAGKLFKSMVFVHGADHKGLVGDNMADTSYDADAQFISTEDQLCVTKAYTLAFLQWHLLGQSLYQDYFKPPYYQPQSLKQITSESSDYMGYVAQSNPAGSPLRLYLQSSPPQKLVVQNFERGDLHSYLDYENQSLLFKSQDIAAQMFQGQDENKAPFFMRNITKKMLIGWENKSHWQHFGFQVPAGHQQASAFTHVSIRLAQLFNSATISNGQYANPPGELQRAYLVLVDGNGKQAFTRLDHWGDIPFNDVRSNGSSHSGFNTISVPLSAFQRYINTSSITIVGLVFLPNTSGALLVDNLEWVNY